MKGSKPFKWGLDDTLDVGKNAVLVAVAAVLTYLMQWVSNTDFGDWTPVVVSISAVITNTIRKWIADTRSGDDKTEDVDTSQPPKWLP